MKAMVLAAGLGTRLRPLTDDRPKALVEIEGRTLLEITLARLREFGVREVIVNVHHFADMVVDYLAAKQNFGMRIEVSREDVLLDTGGGLKQAAWFFLEDASRRAVSAAQRGCAEQHRSCGAWCSFTGSIRRWRRWRCRSGRVRATCCSMSTGSFAGGGSSAKTARSWRDLPSRCRPLAFSGVHVISPRLLENDDGGRGVLDHRGLFAARGG